MAHAIENTHEENRFFYHDTMLTSDIGKVQLDKWVNEHHRILQHGQGTTNATDCLGSI